MTDTEPETKTADLRDARVLVTGAAGFIGRHLCRELHARGARVYGAAKRSAAEGIDVGGWHRGDLAVAGVAKRLLAEVEPDLVFHLASLVKGSRQRKWVVPMLESNLVGTVRVLDAAAGAGNARVVLCGSLEEPEEGKSPSSPYAAAKGAVTLYARLFAELYQLPIVHARIFMVYGPGAQDEQKLVPYVIRELIAGRSPSLSTGQRAVDWIDVRDVVEGLLALSLSPAAVGQRLDLGSGELVPVRDVVLKLFQILGARFSPDFGSLSDRVNEVTEAADVAATEALANWRPRIALDQGLRDTVAWFRSSTVETPLQSQD